MNKIKTKFIHAHKNIHLNQNGNFQLGNTGCLSIIPKSQIIHQKVVYQNSIANLNIKSASLVKKGNEKKPINQKIKPKVFAIAVLLANLDLKLNMHILK